MRKTDAFRRAAALLAALSITVSLAAPAFAATSRTYYIDKGDITITKDEKGQTVKQGDSEAEKIGDDDEIIITTTTAATTTQESDLEGPAAEDSGFGPVVEDNYQPAQPEDAEEPKDADRPEDAEEPKDADQPESAEEPKSADRQESAEEQESAGPQPQQAAPAAAPAASTPVNKKENGFWGNTITVINNFANTVLNLTLKDVKIDVSHTGTENYINPEAGKAALSVQGDGNVEIELDGKNELKSGHFRAGLEKIISAGTLTLKDDNQKAGSLTATGGSYSAGIGGSYWGSGENITINGGTVNAAGAYGGAGIGGGLNGIGSKITVSGAAHVTATATASRDPDWPNTDTGATIGNGSTRTPDGKSADGKEIQADINGLTTGWIHHIIYNPLLNWSDEPDTILKEWWEFALPKPIPDGESLDLHVETLKGAPLLFNTRQQGSTLRVTTDNLSARLHGTRQALETLQEQGVEQIQFVTTLKTTTLSVAELLAEGGSWFALEHDGLVSRRLSAAQAESLKCWRH